jgi:hypothetical protein
MGSLMYVLYCVIILTIFLLQLVVRDDVDPYLLSPHSNNVIWCPRISLVVDQNSVFRSDTTQSPKVVPKSFKAKSFN